MTLQFERKYSTQGPGAPCHVSFGFFSGFYGIILAELQINPQLESTIWPKARGLHSIWNAILRIAFSIWFLLQDKASTIEDLQEKNSRTLGNYSRRLQDYSRICWSTFQPQDASSILEGFWLLAFRDAWRLLIEAIKTTRIYPTRLQSTRGLVVWTSLGPLPQWVPGPTTQ
jgi:predicted ATP-grasp superfamily ATP-dependent carboligase